jgi:hypothetical protein
MSGRRAEYHHLADRVPQPTSIVVVGPRTACLPCT